MLYSVSRGRAHKGTAMEKFQQKVLDAMGPLFRLRKGLQNIKNS